MKKPLIILTAIVSMAGTLTSFTANALDYSNFFFDAFTADGNISGLPSECYSARECYKTDVLSGTDTIFDGSDIYRLVNYGNTPYSEYAYSDEKLIKVSTDSVGKWFREDDTDIFSQKSYDMFLPLDYSYFYDYSTDSFKQSDKYEVQCIAKSVPYIKVTFPKENNKIIKEIAGISDRVKFLETYTDTDGKNIYLFSTDDNKNFECDATDILTENEASDILENLDKTNMMSFAYCQDFYKDYAYINNSLKFLVSYADAIKKYCKDNNIDCKITEDKNIITVDTDMPAFELYSFISGLNKEVGCNLDTPSYESISFKDTISVELLNKIKGDSNRDGIISVADLVYFYQYLNGNDNLIYSDSMDINNDNIIDSFDLILLRQLVIDSF